jgi:hypothetical protein
MQVPAATLQAQYDAATDPMQRSFAALIQCVARGDEIDMSQTVKLLPVRLTSVAEYAEKVVGRTPVLA